MIYLLQILQMLSKNQIELFENIFIGFTDDVNDLGYVGFPEELAEELLMNNFGIEIECNKQLDMLTALLLKPEVFLAGVKTYKMKGL